MNTKNLINVSEEVKRLERIISDMEWENQDARVEKLELIHFQRLQKKGVLWEPDF